MLSSICFAWWAGEKFGSNVKQWRLFADVINDVGLTLELIAPVFPDLFLILVSNFKKYRLSKKKHIFLIARLNPYSTEPLLPLPYSCLYSHLIIL